MIKFRPRYSLKFLLLAVTLCAVVLGLQDVHRRAMAKLDAQVVRSVLEDLLSYRGNDSPVAFGGGPLPTKLLFSVQAAGYRQTVREVLYRDPYYEKAWAARTQEDIRQARQAAAHLVRRIGSFDTFTAFNPEDKRIEIAEKQGHRQKSATWSFDRPIQAWPPGYSHNHSFAVVRLSIPWSMHHAEATYLLRKEDGTWKVVLRAFVFDA